MSTEIELLQFAHNFPPFYDIWEGGFLMLLKIHYPSSYIRYLLEVDERIYMRKKDYLALSHYRKGLEGEKKFLHLIEEIEGIIILWDILIELPGEIQYDFIIITEDSVFHFDVKNFSGKYIYEKGNYYSENGYVEKDIMSPLRKGHKKMKQLIKEQGFHFSMHSKIIFINEALDLRNFPGDPDVKFHFEVDKIVKHLKRYTRITPEMRRLADLLVKQHKNDSEHEEIYYYDFNQMKSGVKCSKCGKLGMRHYNKCSYFICNCGHKERNDSVIQRTYDAISLIEKGVVSTAKIVKWTGMSDRTVRYNLSRNYGKIGGGRATYYIDYEN